MADEQGKMGIGEGIRAGVGILAALKQAIEETLEDAAERNELSPERAREAVSAALERAQEAIGDVRERLDVVPRKELDALRAEVDELRRRLDRLDGGGGGHVRFLPGGAGMDPGDAGA